MTLQLLIDGEDKTALLQANSLKIEDELNSRDTMDFTLLDPAGEYWPEIGDPVALYDGTTLVFGGLVSDTDEEKGSGNESLKTIVNCVDYNQLADRGLVAEVYEGMTAGAIVRAIVTKYLAADGVTADGVQDGPTISRILFNYVYASDAFNELCERTGFSWNVGYDRDLKFFGRETFAAPLAFTDTSENFRKMRVRRSLGNYRNRQYLRGGKALTAARIETWQGDGTNRTFTTAFPIGKQPILITVGAVSQTIGIRGIDTERQWYWSKGTDTITQDTTETVVPAGTVIEITYQGLYPIVVKASDDNEIAERAAIEGTSGIYEAITTDSDIDDYELAMDKVFNLLRQKGLIQDVVPFETDVPGLLAGQLIPIQVSKYGLDGEYLIDKITGNDVDGKFMRWTGTALSGERIGGWVEFFRSLALRQQGTLGTEATSEMEVLSLVQTLSDTVKVSDPCTATEGVRDTRADSAYADFCEAM